MAQIRFPQFWPLPAGHHAIHLKLLPNGGLVEGMLRQSRNQNHHDMN
jgi:hypothetical protein